MKNKYRRITKTVEFLCSCYLFHWKREKIILIAVFFVTFIACSCKKLVEVPQPKNSLTTVKVFADSSDANSAILGIYANLFNQGLSLGFGNCAVSFLCGSSADELGTTNSGYAAFYHNLLLSNNNSIYSRFWTQPYNYIYQANASIEGIQASENLSPSVRNRFIGEAKFLRAYCYFYLVNMFGDVPYITSTVWESTSKSSKEAKQEIYEQEIGNLKDAVSLLPDDYSFSGGERTRVNKSAALALLARMYLYKKDYDSAEKAATEVINNPKYALVDSLNEVFLANSDEAIFQMKMNSSNYPYNLTPEGYFNIPASSARAPQFFVSSQLLNAFEPGDQRKIAWIDSSKNSGITYYYPFKYKKGPAQISPNGTPSEYYMVLRLAEQYLIRAEARAENNDLAGAIADLNIIRARAGIPDLPVSLNQSQVLAAVAQERRIELFAEWGHRWFDLKRTGQVDPVMSVVTPQKGGGAWNTTKQLYPIPITELQRDPNLVQNAGY